MSINFETHETLLLVRGGGIKAYIICDRITKALELRLHYPSGNKYGVKLSDTLSEASEKLQKDFRDLNIEPEVFYVPENLTDEGYVAWMEQNGLLLMKGETFKRVMAIIEQLDAVAEKSAGAVLVIDIPQTRQCAYILANISLSDKKESLVQALDMGGVPLGVVGMRRERGAVRFHASLLTEQAGNKDAATLLQKSINNLKHHDRDIVVRAVVVVN